MLTGEVETTDIEDLGVLDELPDLGLLQVIDIVVVGSTEVGAETSVVASDDNTTSSGLLLGVDSVLDTEASSLDGIVKNGGVLVVTGTTEVDDAVGREDVLSTSGGVLSSTTSDELGVVVVQKVLVERDVLLLSEDSVVGLEVILLEKSLVTEGLDIYGRESEVSTPSFARFRPSIDRFRSRIDEEILGKSSRIQHTEERVLQAEKGVFLGGHCAELSY